MVKNLWLVEASLAVLFLAMTWFSTRLWQDVLGKPYLLFLPFLAVVGLFMARVFISQEAWWKACFRR